MKISGILLSGVAAASVAAAGAQANPLQAEPVVAKQHELRVGGKRLRYVSEAGRVPIRDVETGEPHGFMYYTAYRIPSDEPRPVAFIWNGGPGSPSTLLHFEMFGPKRLEGGALVANDETLLTDADLVFVDPIGTGFSRPAKPEYASEFYGTLGDIRSVTEFVRAWRLLNGAEDAPVYLMGESWGAGRAGSVGYALQKIGAPVNGLVLISGGGVSSEVPAELGAALRLVSLIPTVAYHGKLPQDLARDLDATMDEAGQWARETYAPALKDPGSLSAAERDAIVQTIARYTGLDSAEINSETLRVTPRQFREGLLKAEGKSLNVFDMRIASGGGDEEEESSDVLLRYLRHELGYATDLPYIGLDGFGEGYSPSGETPASVGARWDYFTAPMSEEEKKAAIAEAIRVGGGPPRGGPRPPGANEAIEANPDLRVLVASGMYDSLASCPGNAEAEMRLPDNIRAAVDYECYVGGHMMYRDAPSRIEFSRDVKALIDATKDN